MSLRFHLSAASVCGCALAASLAAMPGAHPPAAGPTSSRTPAECLRYVDSAYERARQAATKAHKTFEFTMAQQAERSDARECAAPFTLSTTGQQSLLSLAELYNRGAQDAKAEAAVNRYVSLAAADQKGEALLQAVRTMVIPTTRGISATQMTVAERFAARLDKMGNAAGQQRLRAYRTLALAAPTHDRRLAFFDKAINGAYAAASSEPVARKKAPLLGGAINMALMAWLDQPTAGRSERIDRYIQELEALPDEDAARVKLTVYAAAARTFAGDARELPFINKTLALGRDLQQAAGSSMPSREVVMAYYQMATYYALRGSATQVKDILQHVATSWPDGQSLALDWSQRLAIYDLLDRQAPEIQPNYWVNAPAGGKTVPLKGKVTLLEFALPTGHSPSPPEIQTMSELFSRYGKDRLQIVLVSKLIGYSCCGEQLTPQDEIASYAQFWLEERKLPAKVAIIDPPWTRDPQRSNVLVKQPASFERDYRLRTMPAIVIVDTSGTVRFVAGEFNTAQVSAKLAELLSGKTQGAQGTH